MPVFGISSTAINKPFKSITGFDNNNQTSTNVSAPATSSDAVPLSYLQDAANITTGTLDAAITPAYTGDVAKSAGSLTLTLSATGVSAGTYTSVTVDSKGRISEGTNPTTLSGYGITDAVDLSTAQTVSNKTLVGAKEAKVIIAAANVDLATGNVFTKTVSGAITFTVSNTPAAGTAISFILDLTNGGSAAITWWSGVKWVSGTAPTLTTSGRDVLGFLTHDGGTTWTGLVLGKDVK